MTTAEQAIEAASLVESNACDCDAGGRAGEIIRALLAERNALLEELLLTCSQKNDRIEELALERDALKADAERYRWLRDGTMDFGPNVYEDDDCNTWLTGTELDLAMDKAMARSALVHGLVPRDGEKQT